MHKIQVFSSYTFCFLIYQKDTRGRRLYIATQGKLYINERLNIYSNFDYLRICLWVLFAFVFNFPRSKAKNNYGFLDYDLARRSVQYRLPDEPYGRNKGCCVLRDI